MRKTVLGMMLACAEFSGCDCDYDPWEDKERSRLRKEQAELRANKDVLEPLMYQSQGELALALNGRDIDRLTPGERAELDGLIKKFEGAKYAVAYVDSRIEDVQFRISELDRN